MISVLAVFPLLLYAETGYRTFLDRYAEYMRTGEYMCALDCAREFCRQSVNTDYELLALGYAGQSALAADEYDTAAGYFQRGLDLWAEKDSLERTAEDYSGIVTVLNSMGIYTMNLDMDCRKAVEYFLAGLRLARLSSDNYSYAVLGLNLAVTYNLMEDTSGLKYAKEIYAYGKESGDMRILGSGAYTCALMYFLKNNAEMSECYLDEAVEYDGSPWILSGIYCLKACISEKKGEDSRRIKEYYEKAMETSCTVADSLSVHLYYGKFLTHCGMCDESIEMLSEGLAQAESKNVRIYRYRFYQALSDAYDCMGDDSKALCYFKKYQKEYTDVYSIEKERAISDLYRKYENEQHELEMIKKSRELRTVLMLFLVVIIVLVAVYILYRHKNRMYVSIVRQHMDALKKEAKLEGYISELESRLEGKTTENEKYSRSSLEERKKNELFSLLEKIMKEDKVYIEPGLTGDRLAKIAGTNRTYLSRVVNEKTGMTLVSYVNSYRINEAIAILSDAGNDIPLKALCTDLGFKSMTTFYKLFSDRVGMTPAKYREKILYLSKDGM